MAFSVVRERRKHVWFLHAVEDRQSRRSGFSARPARERLASDTVDPQQETPDASNRRSACGGYGFAAEVAA